jgi:hypothetical protein
MLCDPLPHVGQHAQVLDRQHIRKSNIERHDVHPGVAISFQLRQKRRIRP